MSPLHYIPRPPLTPPGSTLIAAMPSKRFSFSSADAHHRSHAENRHEKVGKDAPGGVHATRKDPGRVSLPGGAIAESDWTPQRAESEWTRSFARQRKGRVQRELEAAQEEPARNENVDSLHDGSQSQRERGRHGTRRPMLGKIRRFSANMEEDATRGMSVPASSPLRGSGVGGSGLDFSALRASARERDVLLSVDRSFPKPGGMSASDIANSGLGRHSKLAQWYQGILQGETDFQSNVVYLEVKLRELLGESFPGETPDPDQFRSIVLVDILGRVADATPVTRSLSRLLLDELVRSVFKPPRAPLAAAREQESAAAQGVPSSPARFLGEVPEEEELEEEEGEATEYGEAYFAIAKRLEKQVIALRAEVLELRKNSTTEEDAKRERMANLLGRVMGNLRQTAFTAWRRVVFANNAWKSMRGQLSKRNRVRWTPRAFYKWESVTEKSRREHWQRIAEMMKWENDYKKQSKEEGLSLAGKDEDGVD